MILIKININNNSMQRFIFHVKFVAFGDKRIKAIKND